MAYHKPNSNSNLPAENERIFSTTGMSKETSPSPLSKAQHTKDSYWFAHSRTGDASPVVNDPKSAGDAKDQQSQKDKEEKIRQFREMQEEERIKRMRDLEQQFQQAKKHREQQEEERRRRIEEARVKEIERRQQVEERKRQIWEAEQERKEAILRRNMEREARIEARRNAQRNSQSYVFGSSTPRTFDLDLAAIGMGRSMNAGSVLMSSVSRRSEERELGPPPRATSACSLDRKFENVSNGDFLLHNDQPDYFRSSSLSPMPSRVSYLSKQIAMQHKSSNEMKACLSMWDSNVQSHRNFFDSPSTGWLVGSGVLVGEDCMSRSMVSLSSSTFRGRKRTDIVPTLTRERSITPHVTPRGNSCMRAVSMTRLDQLAQPRRTYRDPRSFAAGTTTNEGPRTVSPSMSKSMCNLANSNTVGKKTYTPMSSKGSMTRSMLHLVDSPQKENRRLTPSPTMPKSGMRSAQSMMHLAVAPRLTRAARLRAEALAGNRTVSAWNLNKPENDQTSNYLSPAGKDTSRSPSRPQSSMSGTSELSTASSSAVNMRHRPAPRRPRPYSVHGSIVDSSSISTHITKKEPERPTRLTERNTAAPKPERANSTSRENSEIKNTRPLTAPKKPIPPPKPVDVAAKTKPHPVPIKDNLRKRGKPSNKPATDENKAPTDKNEKPVVNSERKDVQEKVGTPELIQDLPAADAKPGSAVTSPTTDSDMMLISSDDSKISAVMGSDVDTFSQSVTESDRFVQESTFASLSESNNASINTANNESEVSENKDKDDAVQSIPIKAQQVEPEIPPQSLQEDLKSGIPPQAQQTESLPVAQQKEVKSEIPPAAQQKDVKPETSALTQQKEVKSEIPPQMQTSFSENMPVPSKPRITSEEEARAALAEKRRLAREQAEREAELERQRLEELRRQEEEQRRLEEEEQRRMEEEQIRLAELHRQLEQEKLAKAIEEQKRREKEEQEKKEEEARQKAEREEQERKAREEAERQRLELQEKLRKEEEERAERKRRVEQIMARTRGRAAAAQSPSNPPSDNTLKPAQNAESPSVNSSSSTEVSKVTSIITNGVKDLSLGKSTSLNGTSENHVSSFNSRSFSEAKQVSNNNPLPDILNSENIAKSNGTMVVTDEQSSKISVSNSFDLLSNRTLSANDDKSPQTNGYSSHEEMSCTTSPEENADVGLLIDIQSSQQRSYKSESADFTKLVDVEPTSLDNNVNNENYLINVDDVNSNLFNSGNPFMGFEDSLQKKQDTSVTDLLS
ncbi:unnamed protein product [Larinioides sclopetarius]|uniref:Ensconsin-like n=2 Tax=Larinioides sclopetarius TaxID=280406 RepID=A0AAV2A1C3_9ARAC